MSTVQPNSLFRSVMVLLQNALGWWSMQMGGIQCIVPCANKEFWPVLWGYSA